MAMSMWLAIIMGLPLIAFIIAWRKKRLLVLSAGVVAFVVSQPLIRLPLLQWLSEFASVKAWAAAQPIAYMACLALTAGLAEELARWLLLTYLRVRRNADGLLFGLGHGGIEAILLVGLPVFSAGLYAVSSLQLAISSAERLFAIIIHVCLTLLVLKAVRSRQFRYVVAAILLHGAINFAGGYAAALTQNVWVIEGIILLAAVLLLTITLYIIKEDSDEKSNDNCM